MRRVEGGERRFENAEMRVESGERRVYCARRDKKTKQKAESGAENGAPEEKRRDRKAESGE